MIRAATAADIPFCALASQAAERAHRPERPGLWDYLFPDKTVPVLEAWTATPATIFYWGNFLVALDDSGVDGVPVAACGGYVYGDVAWGRWDDIETQILTYLGSSSTNGLAARWEIILRCFPPHPEDEEWKRTTFVLESVATVDTTYNRTGRMKALVAAQLARGKSLGCLRVRLTALSDNVAALKLYEGQGFRVAGTTADNEFGALFGSTGYTLMEREL